MPRRAAVLKRRDRGGLDDRARERLKSGNDWLFLEGFARTDEQPRGLWAAYGHQLLADWILERPGTRPWAWWEFNAPAEPRRRVGGVGTVRRGSPLRFGKPAQFEGDYRVDDPPTFEPEAAYLKRHGLLTPSEAGAGQARPKDDG